MTLSYITIEVPSGGNEAAHTEPALVIFLHGRGGSESDVAMVASAFPGATILAPRGPYREGPGFAWFKNRGIGVAIEESVEQALSLFHAWFTELNMPKRHVILCGFSNGAAMAGAIILSYPDIYEGAAILSGPLVLGPPWPDGRLKGKKIFFARGLFDEVIPDFMFENSENYLSAGSGAETVLMTYKAAHEISKQQIIDVSFWFNSLKIPT
jgi:phospholipase/carboxylesterase